VDADISQYYERCYDDANYSGLNGRFHAFYHAAIERPFGPATHFGQVIEVGCARAHHLPFVRHRFDRYLMTDLHPNEPQLDEVILRWQGPGVLGYERQDASAIDHPDNTFDRLISTCVLHHLDDPDAALAEWFRVVRPGGEISIYLPYDPGMAYRWVRWCTTHRVQRRLERRGQLEDHLYMWAREHRNHVLALKQLIRHHAAGHQTASRRYPFPLLTWNANLYEILHITVGPGSPTR